MRWRQAGDRLVGRLRPLPVSVAWSRFAAGPVRAATHVGCRRAGSRVLLSSGHPRHREAGIIGRSHWRRRRPRSIEEPSDDPAGRSGQS